MVKQKTTGSAFETYAAADAVRPGSERTFGLVFVVVFALLGGWAWYHEYRPVFVYAAAGLAALFLLLAFLAPAILRPLNRIWFGLGMLLHHIVNPIVMTALFWLALVPTAVIARLCGRRFMPTKFDRAASSYWVACPPSSSSMKRQF
jgi:hypothetical protein